MIGNKISIPVFYLSNYEVNDEVNYIFTDNFVIDFSLEGRICIGIRNDEDYFLSMRIDHTFIQSYSCELVL